MAQANAFLQLWFYNVAFRNAIYASSPVEGSPLYHLAYIFASLQHTQRPYVDPTVLIEALRLDKGDQQDAGEFCKLFLDLISAELSKQKDPRLKTVTKDLVSQPFAVNSSFLCFYAKAAQFEGSKEVTIICDKCKYKSPRQEPFLELEIPLKHGETLADRILFILSDESLEESNQYNCPRCSTKQNATRRTTLRDLPPILNFTLVRFSYDYRTGEKKKSKAVIQFPRELKVGEQQYRLQAIVSHYGSDNHGHFVCEALDEEAWSWWLCNDETVSKINRQIRPRENGKGNGETEPPNKRLKGEWTGELKSRDAYMLVYSRDESQVSINPPEMVMRKVREDDERWIEELGHHERKKCILEEEYDSMTPAKKQVAALLKGSDHLLPTAELERWFGASSVSQLFGPWTIPTCIHGAIDPENTREFKLVSQAAFDILRDYCTGGSGALEGSVIKNGNGNGHGDGFANGNGKTKDGSYPLLRTFSAPTETSYESLPELSVCSECVAEIYGEKAVPEIVLTQEEKQAWISEVKRDRVLKRTELDKRPQVYGVDYYYLPKSFVEAWDDYCWKPMMPKPELDAELGRCEHGLLDVDLEMDETHYITAQGWDILMDM